MTDFVPAVEYVRMSTEGQKLSIPFQQAAIRLHAAQLGYEIIRTYEDAACSGLYLRGRPSLERLLAEVENGQADFKAILVYDVSRWGRFPDTDESGYYEYLCRRAGVQVIYCAEPFSSENSALVAVLKAIKRVMAAEYSRELSARTHAAMARLVVQGYVPGGRPGYGCRRMVVGPDHKRKGILKTGVYKASRTDRTILVPGPRREVETIRRIYRMFLEERVGQKAIAAILNSEGVPYADGHRWTRNAVRCILDNERYAGTIVFNRTSTKFRKGLNQPGRVKNDPGEWLRGTLPEAIITQEQFSRVQQLPNLRGLIYRDEEELLAPLRCLLKKYGYLSSNLIRCRPGVPSPATLRTRFGRLRIAFERVGYTCRYRPEKNLAVRAMGQDLLKNLKAAVEARGRTADWRDRRKLTTLDNGRTLTVSIAHFSPIRRHPELRWVAHTGHRNHPDYTVVARLNETGEKIIDYYCLPSAVIGRYHTYFDSRAIHEPYRCLTFDQVVERLLTS